MGMSTSSTQLIFFIATMVIASGLVGLFAETIMSISDGVSTRGDVVYDTLMTDITIINDEHNMPNDPLDVYVMNTGKVKLATQADILVDNEMKTSGVNITVLDAEYWEPGEVLRIRVNVTLSEGEHTVKVIVPNGLSDRFTFRI
jgi:flagellar protein FlaG